jgi:hypothetical protein
MADLAARLLCIYSRSAVVSIVRPLISAQIAAG